MSSWVIATAIVGAAAIGPAIGPAVYGQSTPLAPDLEPPAWAEQAVRVLTTGGTHLGVTLRDLDEDDQKSGKAGNGVMIESVETDSPAAKAGIKTGDIVVEFDGERVRSSRQLARLVQETVPGRSVPMAALRDGQRVTMTVQPREGGGFKYLDRFDAPFAKIAPAPMPIKPDVFTRFETILGPARLGIGVSDLSPQLAEYFGTKDGVLVTSVTENSIASRIGVKAGDVVTSLDGSTITDAADLRRRSQRLEPGNEFTLAVIRDKKPLTLKGKIDAPRRTTGRVIL